MMRIWGKIMTDDGDKPIDKTGVNEAETQASGTISLNELNKNWMGEETGAANGEMDTTPQKEVRTNNMTMSPDAHTSERKENKNMPSEKAVNSQTTEAVRGPRANGG